VPQVSIFRDFTFHLFSAGVNMPAKAVVFNSIRKHDGMQFRLLEPGEYTQMAGRAGRRGLDKVGTVILCCFGEVPPPQSMLRQMLTGTSTRLSSNFRLTYGMILNLLKSEAELSVEAMIKRSFSEFATQRALTANEYPQLLIRGTRTLEKLEETFRTESSTWIGAEDLNEYFTVCTELLCNVHSLVSFVRLVDSASFEEIFQPGRVILVSAPRSLGVVRGPAIVLRAPSSSTGPETQGRVSDAGGFICLVLMPHSFSVDKSIGKPFQSTGTFGQVNFVGFARDRHYAIRRVELSNVLIVSDKRMKIDVNALLNDDGRGQQHISAGPLHSHFVSDPFAGMKAFGRADRDTPSKPTVQDSDVVDALVSHLLEVENAELRGHGAVSLSLQNYLKRGSGDVVEKRRLCDQITDLTIRMRSFSSHQHPNLEKFYVSIERKETLRKKVETLRHLLSNESLQLFPDFLQRKAVLLRLGYIEESETIQVKGRVACEVNTCDELLITEMVFEGLLNDLEPAELIAALSSLVWQEKSKDEEFDSELPEKLVTCCSKMKLIATNLGQLQKEIGLPIDPLEYRDSVLRFGIVHVVYEWALGVPFAKICELTDAHEGSIVRCITRLDELCREVRNIARVLGNPTLYKTAEAGSACIKRDIVFASSLYVS
jgi:antiviral helicase SKI2